MLWHGTLENAPILGVTMEPIILYANLNFKGDSGGGVVQW